MKTFAVFQRFDAKDLALQFAKGTFVKTPEGEYLAVLHNRDTGDYWALRFTCGSALRAQADQVADEVGGRVVAVYTDQFPGQHACFDALRAELALAAEFAP